jgi:hypothetical protein
MVKRSSISELVGGAFSLFEVTTFPAVENSYPLSTCVEGIDRCLVAAYTKFPRPHRVSFFLEIGGAARYELSSSVRYDILGSWA